MTKEVIKMLKGITMTNLIILSFIREHKRTGIGNDSSVVVKALDITALI